MKKIKIILLSFVLLCISVVAIGCSDVKNLRIDAPEEIQAELGTYAFPKYDIIDENDIVRAGYVVTVVSIKDPDGNAMEFSGNSIVITEAGIYDFEYSAKTKKIPNVVVKIDFADRTPPTVNVNTDNYPALFIKNHEYSLPQYSYSSGPDLSKCWMKMYYKSISGEKVEKDIDGLFFKVTESNGEYEFVVHGEDAAGNVKELVHTVPVDGPETEVENRIGYFNEAFGSRQLKFSNMEGTKTISASYDESVKYSDESGSTLITIAEETNYAIISVSYPVITDLSNYDAFVFRVYNPNEYKVIFGLTWSGYQVLEPKQWTEFSFPTSYFHDHGSDALQDCDGAPIYEDDITNLSFTVLYERWAQNGNVQAGTKLNISALDARRNEGNDLRISGEAMQCIYDPEVNEYRLGEYQLVNRADVSVETGGEVTLKSAKNPDGTDATIENGVLKLCGEGIYTILYSATYDGDKYSRTIDDLEVLILKGGDENIAVYAGRFGIKQIRSSNNLDLSEGESGSEDTLKMTLQSDQNGVGNTGVLFKTVSSVKNYDYVSFDIRSSEAGVYVAYSSNGLTNYSDHFAYIGTEWTRVSFSLSVVTTWYQDNGEFGLCFFKGFADDAILSANTVFEIRDISFENGNAQISDEERNMAESGAEYLFPTIVEDTHGRYWGGSLSKYSCGVQIVRVVKDGQEVALNADGTGIDLQNGVYTIYYKAMHDGGIAFVPEYSYSLTVSNVPLENEEIFYGASEIYLLPALSIGGKAIVVTGIISVNGGTVSVEDGTFSLVSATPEVQNNTNTYVYIVNYTVEEDITNYSYTVIYRKPNNVTWNRMVYFDSAYGNEYQISVENGSAEVDTKYNTDYSDRGIQSTKITVAEDGAVWLHFNNIPWNTAFNNLDIAFSSSSVLRYQIFDANNNLLREEVAFSDAGSADRWTNIHFIDNLGDKDMSSFSIKLFKAYNEDAALAKDTEIWIVGGLGYTF